jgi:SAM-dependent methyltransferase
MSIKHRAIATLNPLAKSLVPKRLYYWLWSRNKPDRRYFEDVLLPSFAQLKPEHVLSVGTQPYCAHYGRYFNSKTSEYWTMDIEPELAHYGSPGRHITASVTDVDQHFKPGYFDVVLLNGIFGWGVNLEADQVKTLINIRKIIRPGGVLLIGWNDDITKEDVIGMSSAHGFKHGNPMGLPNRKQFPGGTHVYDLFTAV